MQLKAKKTAGFILVRLITSRDRIKEHNIGSVRSTKRDLPWKLYAYEIVSDRKEAMKLEWKIKKSRGFQLKWLDHNMVVPAEAHEKDVYDS